MARFTRRRRGAKRFGRRRAGPRKRFTKRSKRTYGGKRKMALRRAVNRKAANLRPMRLGRSLWPARLYCKMVYYDTVLLTDEVLSYAEYVFSLNSIYDPDVTGTGHQPRGADQWGVLYREYMVRGARYNVQFYASTNSTTGTTATNVRCGTIVGPESIETEINSLDGAFEYPITKKYWRTINLTRNVVNSTASITPWTGRQNSRAKGYVSMKTLMREYGNIDINSAGTHFNWPADYQSTFGSSPPAEQYLVLFVGSMPEDGTTSLIAAPYVYAQVKITYYVELYNPTYPGPS